MPHDMGPWGRSRGEQLSHSGGGKSGDLGTRAFTVVSTERNGQSR